LVTLAAALLCAPGWGQNGDEVPNTSTQKATPGTFAYITVYDLTGASSIAQYRMTNKGILGSLNPATVPAGFSVEGLAVVPDTNYLYALNTAPYPNPSTFLRFSIKSGRLKPSPIASPGPALTPYAFALTPDGRFALVPAQFSPGTVSSYSIGADGDLTLVSTVSAGMNPCIVAIDPTGTFAYVADFMGLVILEYRIAADGSLTPIGSISTGAHNQPYFLGFSPEGFLYSAGCCALQGVSEYSIDSSTGALTHLSDFSTGHDASSEAWAIAFDPTGKYAYVTNTDSDISQYTIASFKVNRRSGALTRNGPDTTAAAAFQIVVDPSGKFVFALSYAALGLSENSVYQFKISSSGTLVPNGTVLLPGNPPEQTSGSMVFAVRPKAAGSLVPASIAGADPSTE
jgi:6-phosphogluconolactonase (cycloisomerase 2 family)